MDFSGQDKASGVKFLHGGSGRPAQGISHFGELCSYRSPKSDQSATIGQYQLGCISLPHRKRNATDAPFVECRVACGRRSASVDIRPSLKMDVLVKVLSKILYNCRTHIRYSGVVG